MPRKDIFADIRPQVTFTRKLTNAEIETKVTRYHGAWDDELGKRPLLKLTTTETIHRGPVSDLELMIAWARVSDEEILDSIKRTESFTKDGPYDPKALSWRDGISEQRDRDAQGRHSTADVLATRRRIARLRGLIPAGK